MKSSGLLLIATYTQIHHKDTKIKTETPKPKTILVNSTFGTQAKQQPQECSLATMKLLISVPVVLTDPWSPRTFQKFLQACPKTLLWLQPDAEWAIFILQHFNKL